MAKKKKEVTIEIVGGNAEGVTGSCTRIDFYGRTILFELGMVQDNSTILANYKENCTILNKIKPKKVEMVIIGHRCLLADTTTKLDNNSSSNMGIVRRPCGILFPR